MATLHLLTGPWGSGKTSVVAHLQHFLPECVVFDWDLIIPGLSLAARTDVHTDSSTWPGLKLTWAIIVRSVLSGGHDVVLCGPSIPNDFAAYDLNADSVRCAYLNWPDNVIAARLRARGVSDANISEELFMLAQLRGSGCQMIDASRRDPSEVAKMVAAWVRE